MTKNKKKPNDPASVKKARGMVRLSKKLKAEWYHCGSDGDTTFADDNQCSCGIRKHHWHCNKCGAVKQLG